MTAASGVVVAAWFGRWPDRSSALSRRQCGGPSTSAIGFAVRSRPLSTHIAYGPLEPSQPAGDMENWLPPHREVDMVEVGDRVVVESEKVGALTRSGVVIAVEDG